MAFGELNRLEVLRDEALAELEESDRLRAIEGDLALLSRPARLVMRYEREAWRHYREAMARVPRAGPKARSSGGRRGADRPGDGRRAEIGDRRRPSRGPGGSVGVGAGARTKQLGSAMWTSGRDRYRKFPSNRAPIDLVEAPG